MCFNLKKSQKKVSKKDSTFYLQFFDFVDFPTSIFLCNTEHFTNFTISFVFTSKSNRKISNLQYNYPFTSRIEFSLYHFDLGDNQQDLACSLSAQFGKIHLLNLWWIFYFILLIQSYSEILVQSTVNIQENKYLSFFLSLYLFKWNTFDDGYLISQSVWQPRSALKLFFLHLDLCTRLLESLRKKCRYLND